MNPKTLAVLAVFGIALYLVFGKRAGQPTYFTGSTGQPTPLSTAGGIPSLETGIANLFSAFGAAPASQGSGTVVTAANAANYPNVPLGATVGSGTDFSLDDNVDYFLANQPKAIVASGGGANTVAPTAPDVNTAGFNGSVLPNNSTISGSFPSLDAVNTSIGYVAPPPGAVASDSTVSLDSPITSSDLFGTSLG